MNDAERIIDDLNRQLDDARKNLANCLEKNSKLKNKIDEVIKLLTNK